MSKLNVHTTEMQTTTGEKVRLVYDEERESVFRALTSSPVNEFLKLSHFQASPTKRVPLTYVEPYRFTSIVA